MTRLLRSVLDGSSESPPAVVGADVPRRESPPGTRHPLERIAHRPTLRQGARSEYVLGLQQRLNRLGATLAEDQIFGPRTASAVQAFQRKHGLVSDGIVGPKTWTALDEEGFALLARSESAAPAPRTVTVGQDPDAIPPAGKPYDELPLALRETLLRSFRDRKARLPDTLPILKANGEVLHPGNLENGFDWAKANPKTVWDALDFVAPRDLNTLRQVFDRWTAAGLPWELVLYIRNIWMGTSRGLKFKCRDNRALVRAVDAAPRLCKENPLISTFTESNHPDQDTWREISTGVGLHVCIGPDTLQNPNDVHIDWHSPVADKRFGPCRYDLGRARLHWADLRNERLPSPYERVPAVFKSARATIARARAKGPALAVVIDGVLAEVNRLEGEVNDRRRACRGAAGEREVDVLLGGLPALLKGISGFL